MSTLNQAVRYIKVTIKGEPASKANSRIVRIIRGKVVNIKSQKAHGYVKRFHQQCPTMSRLLEGPLKITLTIHYASRRPDLDESLILDLLQGKFYENDRQIKEKHVFWRLDTEDPRTDICVEEIPADLSPDPRDQRRGSGKPRGAG